MECSELGQMNIRKNYPKFILNDIINIEKTGNLNGSLESISRSLTILECNSALEHYKLIESVKDLVSVKLYKYPENLELAKKACQDYINNNSTYYISKF